MAVTSLQREDDSLIQFDAVTRRVETSTARVTKHPVEQGFVISDHVSVENLQLSVEGEISDANNNILDLLTPGGSDHAKVRKDLKEIFNKQENITLITPEQTYPEPLKTDPDNPEAQVEDKLVITSLVFEKSKPTRGHLAFRMRLEVVRIVSSQTSVIPEENVDKEVQKAAQKEVKSGTATTTVKSNVSQALDGFRRAVTRSFGG